MPTNIFDHVRGLRRERSPYEETETLWIFDVSDEGVEMARRRVSSAIQNYEKAEMGPKNLWGWTSPSGLSSSLQFDADDRTVTITLPRTSESDETSWVRALSTLRNMLKDNPFEEIVQFFEQIITMCDVHLSYPTFSVGELTEILKRGDDENHWVEVSVSVGTKGVHSASMRSTLREIAQNRENIVRRVRQVRSLLLREEERRP